MTKETAKKLISFDEVDLSSASDTPFDLELTNLKGVKNGAVVKVLGAESEKVQAWLNNQANRIRIQSTQKTVTGKDKVRTAEEDDEYIIESAAIRIVGWSGFEKEYSKENATWLMAKNVSFRMQVLQASNDLGNYSKD
jgi:hypothetical protein